KKLTLTEYKNLKSCGLLIKKPGKTKINLDLRDEAIRNGAYSSIIFQYNKELKIPFLEYNYKKENKKDYEKINEEFKLEQGNLLIITFAKEQSTCENSSLAVMKKINNMKII
ncbi:MAG: DUF4443 domain-containing protein, partial [Nanoarchaeota archaeon]|nr:DUF4443 domain-containing protein [Nanoarchaeota archaeon]